MLYELTWDFQGLSAVVGAIMTARSAELVRRGVIADIPVTPMWLAAATRLFLALDIFKFGHLDLDSTLAGQGFCACRISRRCLCRHVPAVLGCPERFQTSLIIEFSEIFVFMWGGAAA